MPLMLKEILKSKIVNSYRRKAVKVESNIHSEIDDSKIQEKSVMVVKGFNQMKLRRAQMQGNF